MIGDFCSLHYIGGPRDCMKEIIHGEPRDSRKIVRELDRVIPRVADNDPHICEFRDHVYLIKRIGRSSYVAIHDSLI